MQHNLDDFSLIIFGDFGVLTTTPFRDGKLEMLPGRIEFLASLRQSRADRGLPALWVAIAANKGGVAFGLQSEAEARNEVEWTLDQIGVAGLKVGYAVCFAHPKPRAGFEGYGGDPRQDARRKPQPGMLNEIITRCGVERSRVLVVGTYADDCRAAQAAGLAWETTGQFFAAKAPKAARGEDTPPDEDFDPFFDSLRR